MLYSQKTVVLNIQHMNTISDSHLNAFGSYFQYFDANTFRETRVQKQFKEKVQTVQPMELVKALRKPVT